MLTVSHKALSIEILITASLRPNYWPKLTTIGLPTFVIMFIRTCLLTSMVATYIRMYNYLNYLSA